MGTNTSILAQIQKRNVDYQNKQMNAPLISTTPLQYVNDIFSDNILQPGAVCTHLVWWWFLWFLLFIGFRLFHWFLFLLRFRCPRHCICYDHRLITSHLIWLSDDRRHVNHCRFGWIVVQLKLENSLYANFFICILWFVYIVACSTSTTSNTQSLASWCFTEYQLRQFIYCIVFSGNGNWLK